MQIKLLEPSDQERWREYVHAHPAATFYHRLAWKKVLENSFGHRTYYLMAEAGCDLSGASSKDIALTNLGESVPIRVVAPGRTFNPGDFI